MIDKRGLTVLDIIRDGKVHQVTEFAKPLGKLVSRLSVYICDTKKYMGATVEAHREGRKVIAYKLTNPERFKGKDLENDKALRLDPETRKTNAKARDEAKAKERAERKKAKAEAKATAKPKAKAKTKDVAVPKKPGEKSKNTIGTVEKDKTSPAPKISKKALTVDAIIASNEKSAKNTAIPEFLRRYIPLSEGTDFEELTKAGKITEEMTKRNEELLAASKKKPDPKAVSEAAKELAKDATKPAADKGAEPSEAKTDAA